MNFFELFLLLYSLVPTFAYDFQPKVTQVKLSSLNDKTIFYGRDNVLMLVNDIALYSNDSGQIWSSVDEVNTNNKVTKIEKR